MKPGEEVKIRCGASEHAIVMTGTVQSLSRSYIQVIVDYRRGQTRFNGEAFLFDRATGTAVGRAKDFGFILDKPPEAPIPFPGPDSHLAKFKDMLGEADISFTHDEDKDQIKVDEALVFQFSQNGKLLKIEGYESYY